MYMTATAYPTLRAGLAPECIEWSDAQIEALVAELYGPAVGAEDVESFWSDAGKGFLKVGKSVGRFAQQAAPGIAQGALTGASVGGPFGAIAGAVAGGAGGILSRSKNKTLRGIGGAIGGATQLASQFLPAGRLGGAVGQLAGVALGAARGGARGGLGGLAQGALGALGGLGGQRGTLGALARAGGSLLGSGAGRGGAANALMGLLSRPETTRALTAAALGPAGRSQVSVGGHAVPVQSILSALGGLAGRAAGEAEAEHAGMPAYFYGADGELAIDPADAEQRTDALLELFAATPVPWPIEHHRHTDETDESDEHDEAVDESVYSAEDLRRDAWLLANEAQWQAEWAEEYRHA
ncbi:hypothetical protein HLB44_01865 [Aquincola sp. S2]|uniref:Glycine zipper domain-containing protein n=1 Tax=Pseudaquabacterium terrae TaxID=2732868 RepID=A0ABX2EA68_9BURK|nr:hypothetical protein [Aquabacterium terrae]NRF65723.1 hypothetical protein [Aquabacterium terrae]